MGYLRRTDSKLRKPNTATATELTVVEKGAETTSKSNLFSLGRELLGIELSRVGWSIRRPTLQEQSTQTNQ